MKRIACRTLLSGLLAAVALPAAAQTLDDLQGLWKETMRAVKDGKDERANALFEEFNRKTRAYLTTTAPNWDLKYLVGTLNCQFPAARAKGAALLQDMLQNDRDLGPQARAEVTRVLDACRAASAAMLSPASYEMRVGELAHLQAPGVRGDTKGGYEDLRSQESTSAAAVVPMPADMLLARRVPASEPARALDAAKRRIGLTNGAVVGGFAVVVGGPADDPTRLAEQIGTCLTRYQAPLRAQFGMSAPAEMITVYQAGWVDQVYDNARRLHGLQLPQGVVAYSVALDMSLVGIAARDACGSMAHELVHLMMRSSFPMSPPWLEEGLASAVALAWPEPSRFRFARGWRDATLANGWSLRPSVGQLLDMSWADFSASSRDDIRRAAAVQAMAAVFIRYLDERGKLRDVYLAARDERFGPDLTPGRSYREIVEVQLGRSSDQIDQDFQAWFGRRSGESTAPCEAPASPMQQQGCRPSPMNNPPMNNPPMNNLPMDERPASSPR
jgi:hypothetical protein